MKASKLKSGSWSVNACCQGMRRRFTGPDKRKVLADAAVWVNEVKAASAKGTFLGACHEFMDKKSEKLSPATLRGYNNILRKIEFLDPAFIRRPIATITDSDLQEFIDSLDLAPKTVRNYFGFISSVFTFKHIRTPYVTLPRGSKPKLRIPEEETVRQLLSLAYEEDRSLWICLALAATGPLRRGEIAALSIEDCDFDLNTIHVCHDMVYGPDSQWHIKEPKTGASDRILQMSPRVMEAIQDQGYVTKWVPMSIYDHFVSFCKRHDLPSFRFHDLRHYCASYLHAKGYPDSYIQARTGHASAEILHEIYTHVLQDERKRIDAEMVSDMEELFS